MGCPEYKCKRLLRNYFQENKQSLSSIKRFSSIKHTHMLKQIRFWCSEKMRCWKLRLSQNHRAGGSSRGHLVHLPVSIQNSSQQRKLFILFLKIFSINCFWPLSQLTLFFSFFFFLTSTSFLKEFWKKLLGVISRNIRATMRRAAPFGFYSQ